MGRCKALAIDAGSEISNKAIQSSAGFYQQFQNYGIAWKPSIDRSPDRVKILVKFSVVDPFVSCYICDKQIQMEESVRDYSRNGNELTRKGLLLTETVMYEALVNKDSQFEGLFFAAVKTTGIFCRSTCTARKPKQENVEFFLTTKEALINGYRPCKICRPLENPGTLPQMVESAMRALQDKPDVKLSDYTLFKQGIEPTMLRRWFIKHHGMTFQAYQRLMRINHAMTHIRKGDKVIEAAFETGYESLSGFQHSFKKATKHSPRDSKYAHQLTATRIVTPLGPMLVVANETGICLVEFTDRRMLETELKHLEKLYKSPILPGRSLYFELVEKQMTEYFEGKRTLFDLPIETPGTVFQKAVWTELGRIPYGTTRSYKQQAIAIGNPLAVRAVAKANGFNRLCIIIPCHRVVGDDGHLTGYGGGIWRKKWLLEHEKSNSTI